VGDSAALTKVFSEEYVSTFGRLSGDANPLHADPSFAARTRFGRPIAQGMLVAALISGVIGTRLPGPGSVYIRQSLEFLAPVYLGDEITARVTVVDVRKDKPIATLQTECINDRGEKVISGEAVILIDEMTGD
jgi:3-hydroxybutyryl-CoA dehydratase